MASPSTPELPRASSITVVEVLVAEADTVIAQLLQSLVLEVRADAFVHVVSDGEAALAYCENRLPDLVIADHDLPRLGGVELLRLLRRRPREVALPFILISSHLDAPSVRAALQYAPTAYVAKPLQQDGLRHRLQALLADLRAGDTQRAVSLESYLERVRTEGHGAPLFNDVRDVVSLCLSSAERDLGDLEQTFHRDPQITAMLIYASNSAAQHLGAPCQTLAQAMQRLGVPKALSLVLSLTLQRSAVLGDERLAFLAKDILATGLRSAELARWLARDMNLDANLCYTAALLHNIGELALLRGMQGWLDCGGELSAEQISQSMRQRAAGFGSALRIHLRLSLPLRELIAAFYGLERGIYSHEALVLNLTRCLLQLPAETSARSLVDERCASMLQMDVVLLERIPQSLYRVE